jgi:hypothetical protein
MTSREEKINNTLQKIRDYENNKSVKTRNEVVLSYKSLIWHWILRTTFDIRIDEAWDAFQFVSFGLIYYLERRQDCDNYDRYIRFMIPKLLHRFRFDALTYNAKICLVADNGLLEIMLASGFKENRVIEENEIWETVENCLKSSNQQLLLARKIWRDGWSLEDVASEYRIPKKNINLALVKARNKIREVLIDYDLPKKKGDRDDIHKQIIECYQKGLGATALAQRFGYSRDNINKILQTWRKSQVA